METEFVIYFLAFFSSFIFVFLKSFQQLNVQHSKYLWIVPTSLCMAVCEVYVMWQAATKGWGWIVLPVGLGGGIGSILATWIHSKVRT